MEQPNTQQQSTRESACQQSTCQQTNWYVIQVLTGSEQAMCQNLIDLLDEELYEHCFVPMAERQRRKDGKYVTIREPLFPGYLFIVSDHIEEINAALWKIAKFKRILRAGTALVPLYLEEVETFRSLTDEAFNITMSRGLIVGQAITVTEGPLKGYEGWIKKIDRHKRTAYIEVPFLGTKTRIRVPLEIVEKR
ncbi:MAG TPA: antiterminator LoaP [Bacillota bacterium]|jgi:transcriptional antiterminator NusG|nr:antiterminator LoaP [Bacillota bacterium]HPZ59503.1 antiterminator LoaP [Bacillota bacterium]